MHTLHMTRAAWRALPSEIKAWRLGRRWIIDVRTGEVLARVQLLRPSGDGWHGRWAAPKTRPRAPAFRACRAAGTADAAGDPSAAGHLGAVARGGHVEPSACGTTPALAGGGRNGPRAPDAGALLARSAALHARAADACVTAAHVRARARTLRLCAGLLRLTRRG